MQQRFVDVDPPYEIEVKDDQLIIKNGIQGQKVFARKSIDMYPQPPPPVTDAVRLEQAPGVIIWGYAVGPHTHLKEKIFLFASDFGFQTAQQLIAAIRLLTD